MRRSPQPYIRRNHAEGRFEPRSRGCRARLRDELDRTQREALEQSHANGWGRHSPVRESSQESLQDAVRSVDFAMESIRRGMRRPGRPSVTSLRRRWLPLQPRSVRRQLTASEVLARQQRRKRWLPKTRNARETANR